MDSEKSVSEIIKDNKVAPMTIEALPIGDLKSQATDNVMWTFIIVAVVALVVIYFIVRHSREWYGTLNKPFDEEGSVMFILLCLCFVILGYASFRAFHCSGKTGYMANMCMVSFGVVVALMILWAFLFFRHHNIHKAFYVNLLLAAATAWMMWCFWKTGDRMSFYLTFIWAIFLIALIYHNHCIIHDPSNSEGSESPSHSSRSNTPSQKDEKQS